MTKGRRKKCDIDGRREQEETVFKVRSFTVLAHPV